MSSDIVLEETRAGKNWKTEEEIGMTGDDMEVLVIDLWEQPPSFVAFLFVFWR